MRLGHDFSAVLSKLAAFDLLQVVGDAGAHDDIGRFLGLKCRFTAPRLPRRGRP